MEHQEDDEHDLRLRLLTLVRCSELRTDDLFHAVNLLLVLEDVEVEQLQQHILCVAQVLQFVLQQVLVATLLVQRDNDLSQVVSANADTVTALHAYPEADGRENHRKLA